MAEHGKGMVHVYTGEGKGKTTAAFGLALRAIGEGLKVIIFQFLKGKSSTGETVLKDMSGNVKIVRFENEVHPMFLPKKEFNQDKLSGQIEKDFSLVSETIMKGEYDLVILDEINNVMRSGWLNVEEVKDLIKKRPERVELVLTGRNAPQEIMEMADYVTEMRSIKHPSDRGVRARRGIEF